MGPVNEQITAAALDTQFDALGHVERRRLLLALCRGQSPDPWIDLDRFESSSSQANPATAMHHVHLPKLAAMGYVEVDREHRKARRGPDFGEIEPVLGLLAEYREELPGHWTG